MWLFCPSKCTRTEFEAYAHNFNSLFKLFFSNKPGPQRTLITLHDVTFINIYRIEKENGENQQIELDLFISDA